VGGNFSVPLGTWVGAGNRDSGGFL
jgi:hypothetical protein